MANLTNKTTNSSEQTLISLLKTNTGAQLLSENGFKQVKALVFDLSYGLTFEQAVSAKKIFQIKKQLGPENLTKLLSVIIKSFCDSIKAVHTMDVVDIFEAAELLSETYTHDSVKDIILALKMAKKNGKNFHHVVSTAVIFEIVQEYFDKKAAYFEKEAMNQKSKLDGSTRTEAYTLAASNELYMQRQEKMHEKSELKQIKETEKEIKSIQDTINKALDSKL